jgi:hypothetical protein
MRRLVVALALLAAAFGLALLAEDARRWPDRFRTPGVPARGDSLPVRVPESALGIEDDLELRRALRLVAATRGRALDTVDQFELLRRQGRAESALTRYEESVADPRRRSYAVGILGVLYFEDALASGSRSGEFVEQSLAALRRAVRLDPANETAKYDLELLLVLAPPREQRDRAGGGGSESGGASLSRPGEGY